jgi:peptide-methionine (R)-S-oxide reductase
MMHIKFALIFLSALLMWDNTKVTHSDNEWRAILGIDRYCVMRRKATERAYSGKFLYSTAEGTYHCAGCGLALFSSVSKYDANTGWPSFHEPIIQKHVWIKEDLSLPFRRYEVLCRSCDSHLGHVFRESNNLLRYTINSIALEFLNEN